MQVAHPDAVFARYSVRSSAMRLVSVVTSTRSPHRDAQLDFRQQVVDLGAGRANDRAPGRPARSGAPPARPPALVLFRSRPGVAETNTVCAHQGSNSSNLQRPVVQRRRQAEAVFDQVLLARAVALVHAADLRNGDVRLVDEHQRVGRQVVDQGRRRLARGGPTDAASSSRCPCRSPAGRAFRGRSGCAARCAALRPATFGWKKRCARRSSSLIASMARSTVARGVT
jgi:hypothetical protein